MVIGYNVRDKHLLLEETLWLADGRPAQSALVTCEHTNYAQPLQHTSDKLLHGEDVRCVVCAEQRLQRVRVGL